ncbi:MAG: dihydroneopterin aldolase [Verrucomicrobiota bacterium]
MEEAIPDQICIRSLRIGTRIGVPDEERRCRQTLEVDIDLFPTASFDDLDDDLSKTIDYDALSQRVRQWVMATEYRLLETLIADLAALLLKEYPLQKVRLEIRKFILPMTDGVAVRIERAV